MKKAGRIKEIALFAVLALFVILIVVYAYEDFIYDSFDDYPWTGENNTIENPACSDRKFGGWGRCGVKGIAVNHSINDSNANYYLTGYLENLDNITKTIEYELYVCRCDEGLGNPPGICHEYYPFINNTAGDHRTDCLGLGRVNDTLLPYEKKNYSMNVSQYRNQLCGSFQVDLHLFKVNNASCVSVMFGGVALLCNNCPEPYCGDGILDVGEECDDGNNNNYDSCRNDCTLPYCGDGIVDSGEECDDGNDNNFDDCRNDCTRCPDRDRDCVCDNEDECDNSREHELINEQGCDPFQFCGKFNCGSCEKADFIPKYQDCEDVEGEPEPEPLDCITGLIHKEGFLYPKCLPLTCLD